MQSESIAYLFFAKSLTNMSSTAVQCAYIGLGAMGKSMAGHIARKITSLNYPPLLVYNRTQARAEDFQKENPQISKAASSLEEIAKKADIIFSCLLNDAAVQETVKALKPHLKSGAILVESSTIAPAIAQDLAKQLKEKDVTYIACPVMGPPVKAASGDLTVLMAGGNPETREKVKSLLIPVIGKKAIELGMDDVAESLRLKLCGNYYITGLVELIAEGMTLGEAAGVGQQHVKELLDCVFPNTLLGVYAGRMLNNTYRDQVAFSMSAAKKDVNHIMEMAKDVKASVPITEVFLDHLNQVQAEQGDLDLSAVVGKLRQKAGLDFDLKKQ
ncbi:hypothetical protein BDF20DRAFT_878650 [Mycotypha africana]|uniref:uncharacterized protein n=1 Tax=Mycotypha africana TaxID=64632 RepID=UPI00230079FD|nr:uncharacterized protein BDF20DRAFT_878650 [Mycotypha africana]KAI8975439.1 hypothetical protein BDF20DRAFT_878650 [Mycotypha africana]